MHRMRRNVLVTAASALALSPLVIFAWTGPTEAPTGGNVAAPINVGTTDQVKNANIGINGLVVFGNSLFGGSTGSNAYLNFGATVGTNGYGIRDNNGLLEFKNSSGSWSSIQATVFNLVGGAGSWAASGNNIYNTNTGNVGIGTTNPFFNLDVSAPAAVARIGTTDTFGPSLIIQGGTSFFIRSTYTGDTEGPHKLIIGTLFPPGTSLRPATDVLTIYGGRVGISTVNPITTLDVNGTASINGTFYVPGLVSDGGQGYICGNNTTNPVWRLGVSGSCNPSDVRLKDNIDSIDPPSELSQILSLRPVSFLWKDPGHYGQGEQVGLIAQEVEPIFPSFVDTGSDGLKSVAYQKLVVPLIGGVQELSQKSVDLENALKEQQKEIDDLKAQIAALRQAK